MKIPARPPDENRSSDPFERLLADLVSASLAVGWLAAAGLLVWLIVRQVARYLSG